MWHAAAHAIDLAASHAGLVIAMSQGPVAFAVPAWLVGSVPGRSSVYIGVGTVVLIIVILILLRVFGVI
jgi:hypothetical protein